MDNKYLDAGNPARPLPERVVFDTSTIIEGLASKLIEEDGIPDIETVIVPRIVLDELQTQASKNLESGFVGLNELRRIRETCEKKGVEYYIFGELPKLADIRLARSGRLDALIIDVAGESGATLYTSDYVMYLAAEAQGISSVYVKPEIKTRGLGFEKFFDPETLSVHLKEGVPPMAKKGRPGNFRLEVVGETSLSRRELESMIKEVLEAARISHDAFLEIESGGATVIQLGQYRIAMARPPFSEGLELTAVRPLVKLTLEDYDVPEGLLNRLREKAEGILIAGPPGSGKSTLASSIAEFYQGMGKVVKTLESPRDLQVGPKITQYGPLEGDFEKTADILLLVRPDHTVFDEIRKTRDFEVFADLRLAGVGMVGVVHASSPIDAIQRFIGRVELGMIPHIIDTVLFVKDGRIEQVLELTLTVKVPTGMTEADLARPLVEVRDFDTGELVYEIYTFGEENVVVPVGKMVKPKSGVERLAEERLSQFFHDFDPKADVELRSDGRAIVRISKDVIPRIIGRRGERISEMERALGVRISIQPRVGGEEPRKKRRRRR